MKSGEGRILSPGEVEWTAADGSRERLSARHLVIAWGSEPALPPGVQPSERILTSDGILSLANIARRAFSSSGEASSASSSPHSSLNWAYG